MKRMREIVCWALGHETPPSRTADWVTCARCRRGFDAEAQADREEDLRTW
jgi:hypothetical protein